MTHIDLWADHRDRRHSRDTIDKVMKLSLLCQILVKLQVAWLYKSTVVHDEYLKDFIKEAYIFQLKKLVRKP